MIVCCETYKFSERVRLEGVGGNERGEWARKTMLLRVGYRADHAALLGLRTADGHDDLDGEDDIGNGKGAPSNLTKLNLMYDLTPAAYITAVASEVGLSGPESVAILLRDYKSILFGS